MMKKNKHSPAVTGDLEISHNKNGIFIGGTPEGFKSFANLLMWLSEYDQEIAKMPDGERVHVHLHPKNDDFGSLTHLSIETEVCRLDARGSGELPSRYNKK